MRLLLFSFFTMLYSSLTFAQSVGFGGRLANSNGQPVTGAVDLEFEILKNGIVVCSKTLDDVTPGGNGLFSVQIDYAATCTDSKTLSTVINEALAASEPLALRVKNVTDIGAPITYPEQIIVATPISLYASSVKSGSILNTSLSGIAANCTNGKILEANGTGGFNCVDAPSTAIADGSITAAKLHDMGATNNQVLQFNGTAWAPATIAASGGTVTEVTANLPLSVATGTTTPVLSIADATGAAKGVVQVGDDLAVAAGIISFDRASIATCILPGQKLYMTPGPAFSWQCASEDDPAVAMTTTSKVGRWDGSKFVDGSIFDNGTGVGVFTNVPTVEFEVNGTIKATDYEGDGTQLTGIAHSNDPVFTGDVNISNNAVVKFYELSANGSEHIAIKAPTTLAATTSYILPSADGTDGQVLKTDGAGNLAWVTPSASGGAGGDIVDGSIVDADIAAGAAILWSKLDKTGSSLADLTTKSAADLTSGILADARMPDLTGDVTTTEGAVATTIATGAVTSGKILDGTIVNDDINAAAGITYSKLSIADGDLSIAKTSGLQTTLDGKIAGTALSAPPWTTAVGFGSALQTTGAENSAFGTQALFANSAGHSNTAIGFLALYYNEGGNYNTAIGHSAGPNTAALSNTTALGYGAVVTASNTVVIGNTSVTKTTLRGTVETTALSVLNQGEFRFYEHTDNGTNYVGFKAPANVTTDLIWTLPASDGAADGYLLKTDGAGVLSWVAPASAPVTSVNGETGVVVLDKADVGLGNVENTALSTWVGSANITTVGTITSGTWDGTNIPYSKLTIADGDLSIAKTSGLQTTLDGKLSTTLADGNILVGNGSSVATAVAMSGDVTMTNAGVTSIGDEKVFDTHLAGLAASCGVGEVVKTNGLGSFYCASDSVSNWTLDGGNVYRSSGKVGIGTTSPIGTLHLASGNPTIVLQDIDSTGDSQYAFLSFRDSAGSEQAWLGFGSDSNDDFTIANSYSGGHIVLSPNNGNVGIGTSTPATKLDINGSLATRARTPAQITTTQNNYDPGNTAFLRISSDTIRTVTGLSGGVDGRILKVLNVGSYAMLLTHQGADSTAANRIISPTAKDFVLPSNNTAELIYDATQSRWIITTPKIRTCETGNPNDVMVAVGSWCVDKYEASIWSVSNGTGTQYGASSDNYPAGFPDQGYSITGTAYTHLYAVSKPGVTPSRSMTWYQAAQACANSGKVLIPDSVWQMAASGTYDPGSNDGSGGGACNTSAAGPRSTASAGATPGAANSCISRWGAEDMIGNLWEWTDLNGVQAGRDMSIAQGASVALGNNYGADGTWNINGESFGYWDGVYDWRTGAPAAAIRGGTWYNGTNAGVFALYLSRSGTIYDSFIGFRCAAPL